MVVQPQILQPQPASTLACPVLVGRQQDGIWVARLLGWAECSAQGATREDALSNLEQRLTEELAEAELTQLEIPLHRPENPWLKLAGKYKDDPDFEEVVQAIAQYRQSVDAAGVE